jgi:ribonuclease HI
MFADASHDSDTQACGWAWWLASNRGKVGGQGHELLPVLNSSVAETLVIFRGLTEACRQGYIHPGDNVLIQTDCHATICAIKGKRSSITEEEKVFADGIKALQIALGLVIKMRHVKGHTAGECRRTRSNNMCDERARIEMTKARQILKYRPR